jgi:hypothetical protein
VVEFITESIQDSLQIDSNLDDDEGEEKRSKSKKKSTKRSKSSNAKGREDPENSLEVNRRAILGLQLLNSLMVLALLRSMIVFIFYL